jgi:hypothetical protein
MANYSQAQKQQQQQRNNNNNSKICQVSDIWGRQ